ncbi:ISL3 family transposase [Streptosporangium canum]|uniref:ISL3 family transposase n=1 Tax=Streptosporangium canum TaxID=324952 RepID=UPI003791E0F5
MTTGVHPSGRAPHGSYRRRLRDLAASGRPVVIELQVLRFLCENPACDVRTFAEPVPMLAPRWQRGTPSLRRTLEAVALALGGRAGTRLAEALGVRVSRSTLIRLLRALPDPEIGQVVALGVDDFAKRRGYSYATILIDMDTHRPIDVLDDSRADTLAEWLRAHPGIEVICRDRAGAYAEGAREGAPEAIQVADRFHLWQNLCRAVEKTVVAHRAALREPEPESELDIDAAAGASSQTPIPSGSADDTASDPTDQGRLAARTRERHAAIHALLDQGKTHTQVCRILGLGDKTVRRYRQAATVEELLTGSYSKAKHFDRFLPYLEERWNAGITNAAQLTRELRTQGYRGSVRTVRRYLEPLRAALATPSLPSPAPTVREMTRWITRRPDALTEDERQRLKAVLARCPELEATAAHVGSFATMMTGLQGDQLGAWMTAIEADSLPHLRSFAHGLRRDLHAVVNGLTLSYSSGAVEGTVNKIKFLKRQMFGRANFDLLRIRVLHHA